MIKSITITNHMNDSVTIDITNPYESGFIVESIDGIGPVNASINFTELATNDGAVDNSARVSYRAITLSLLFVENPTIEDTRLNSYKFFPVKHNITFKIETDNRVCQTVGRVESNEPDIFSDKEGCQISILCPDPYFYEAGPGSLQETWFHGVDPMFEFEFGNEITYEPIQDSVDDDILDNKSEQILGTGLFMRELEMGEIHELTEGFVNYVGDSDIGVTIKIHALGLVTGLAIYDLTTRDVIRLSDKNLMAILGSLIKEGDEITICTVRGRKKATFLRDGIEYNIMNAIEYPAGWFQLTKGNNHLAYTANEGLYNIRFVVENQIIYGGI